MTGLLGAFAEAWDEVRVHKSRVVLSLVGVFLAVFAMTSVTAIGQIVAQVQQEQAERFGGRPATLSIQAYDPMTGMPPDPAEWDAAVAALLERYDITTAATQAYEEGLFRMPGGTMSTQVRRVSPSFGPLHRVEPIEGRWFREGDRASLSPALVVNEAFLRALGVAGMSSRPTVVLGGPRPRAGDDRGGGARGLRRGLVVYRVDRSGGQATASRREPHERVLRRAPALELWVPPEQADEALATALNDLRLSLDGVQVDGGRMDDQSSEETIATLRLAIRGAGIVVLVLGGLGVLNIGPECTVRQRIREIGVRRSFGATSGRIFSAVMLESVCATALAGVAAVAASIVLVRNLPLESCMPVSERRYLLRRGRRLPRRERADASSRGGTWGSSDTAVK